MFAVKARNAIVVPLNQNVVSLLLCRPPQKNGIVLITIKEAFRVLHSFVSPLFILVDCLAVIFGAEKFSRQTSTIISSKFRKRCKNPNV
jgi:hypothetical protein